MTSTSHGRKSLHKVEGDGGSGPQCYENGFQNALYLQKIYRARGLLVNNAPSACCGPVDSGRWHKRHHRVGAEGVFYRLLPPALAGSGCLDKELAAEFVWKDIDFSPVAAAAVLPAPPDDGAVQCDVGALSLLS